MKLTSPNYPEPYDKLENCAWKITAPSGHFVTLDFEIIHVSDKDIPILPTILLSSQNSLFLPLHTPLRKMVFKNQISKFVDDSVDFFYGSRSIKSIDYSKHD